VDGGQGVFFDRDADEDVVGGVAVADLQVEGFEELSL
jgi:hypothetical protein